MFILTFFLCLTVLSFTAFMADYATVFNAPLRKYCVLIWLLLSSGLCVTSAYSSSNDSVDAVHQIQRLQHAQINAVIHNSVVPSSAVTLPFFWDKDWGRYDGSARFTLQFKQGAMTSAQALYLSHIGNRFKIYLNGVLIAERGDWHSVQDNTAKQPQYFTLPQNLLLPHQQENQLVVDIAAHGGARAGLSVLQLGPSASMLAMYQDAYHMRISASLISTIVSTLLGIFSLLLWLRQKDRIYLWYAAGELLWALQSLDLQLLTAPIPSILWQCIILSAYALAPICIAWFALDFMRLHNPRSVRTLSLYMLATIPVVVVAQYANFPLLWQLWKCVLVMLSSYVGMMVVRHAYRSPAMEERVLGLAVFIIVIMALRDLIVVVVLPGMTIISASDNILREFLLSSEVSWTRYGWGLFGIALAWIIAERLRQSNLAILAMNQNLAQKLKEREAELQLAFAQQLATQKTQVTQAERQRLTRDMHDGLGAQLLTALHMAQDQDTAPAQLTGHIRKTLDHLKLTVDAMQDTEGDIASLLGALRYRLGPRLRKLGVELHWDVAPLPNLPGWHLAHSRDLQMLLFEAFSNLMAHAQAQHATLHASYHVQQNKMHIRLSDDGIGLPENSGQVQHGKGLVNMQQRAAKLHAILTLQNSLHNLSGMQLDLWIDCTKYST